MNEPGRVTVTGDKDGRGGPKRVSVDKDPTCFTVTQALQGVQRMLEHGLITSPSSSGPQVISRKEALICGS